MRDRIEVVGVLSRTARRGTDIVTVVEVEALIGRRSVSRPIGEIEVEVEVESENIGIYETNDDGTHDYGNRDLRYPTFKKLKRFKRLTLLTPLLGEIITRIDYSTHKAVLGQWPWSQKLSVTCNAWDGSIVNR